MLTADGAQRLRQVRHHILANPAALRMDLPMAACGTVGCIAGHLCFTAGIHRVQGVGGWEGILQTAAGLLGFADDLRPLNELFYLSFWPSALRQRFIEAPNPSDAALTAAQIIDAFLWTHGFPPNEIQARIDRRAETDEVGAHTPETVTAGAGLAPHRSE